MIFQILNAAKAIEPRPPWQAKAPVTQLTCMKHDDFRHIDTWVFDLDQTLYPASMALFDQIHTRMSDFVASCFERGTTKPTASAMNTGTRMAPPLGLMARHDIPPTPYLDEVHEIDFSILKPRSHFGRAPCAAFGAAHRLHQNGTADYARNVLAHRGLSDLFDAIYGVEDATSAQSCSKTRLCHGFQKDAI